MKLSQIKKNPANPRTIRDEKFERLKRSLKDFPQMMELRPIIVDEAGMILGGNMRFEALKALGMREVPDSWVKKASDLTEQQKQEFIIKDNAPFGAWDWDCLANEWTDLPLSDWGVDIPTIPTGDEWGDALAKLPTGDKSPFQQMTFTVSDTQAEEIKSALNRAKALGDFIETGNENSNGNALARVCETFLTHYGRS